MATQNRWSLGTMYYGGLLNGQPFYTQPDGPGTQVFPAEVQGAPWPEFPIQGMVFSYGPWFVPGCLHPIHFWTIIREYDYDEDVSCALVTCSVCNYCQSVIRPFEEWLNPIQRAIIVG